MLRIAVVDLSGDARKSLTKQITQFSTVDLKDLALMPRINVKPLTSEELQFNAAPDLCIVGEEISSTAPSRIAAIKKILPDTPLLVKLKTETENLASIERLARLGADGFFSDQTTPLEFFKTVILLTKARKKESSGEMMVVDSGKGGAGVTSVVAGLGETISLSGKRVVLLDFDFESQDLSRFLQARPFVNENLQLLLEGSRPVSDESVEQCLTPVWEEEDGLYCMAPPPDSEGLYDPRSGYSRALVSILEVLDELFDVVVIDIGGCSRTFVKTIYRVADKVIFLVNDDPASLYACASRISALSPMMSPEAKLFLLENSLGRASLPSSLLREEFSAASGLNRSDWLKDRLCYSKSASRWPGSGETFASIGDRRIAHAFKNICLELGVIEGDHPNTAKESTSEKALQGWRKRFGAKREEIGPASTNPKQIEERLRLHYGQKGYKENGNGKLSQEKALELFGKAVLQ